MKLTSALATAAAVFGQSVPAARSQGIAHWASRTGLFQDVHAKFSVPSAHASKSLFSGGRAQLSLSDECVDEIDMILEEDDGYDEAFFEMLGNSCPNFQNGYLLENGNIVRIFSLSGCDDSPLRDYCDANYQTTEWPTITYTCTIDGLTIIDYWYDMIGCSGVSCPAEFDLQDYYVFDSEFNDTVCDPVRLIEEGEEPPPEPVNEGPETLTPQCQNEIIALSQDFEVNDLFGDLQENCTSLGDYTYEGDIISIAEFRDGCFDIQAMSAACESKNCQAIELPDFKFVCPGASIYGYSYPVVIGESCPSDPAVWTISDVGFFFVLQVCDGFLLEDGEEPPPRPTDPAVAKGAKKKKAAKKAKSSKEAKKSDKKAK